MPATITWHAFDLKSGRRGPQITTKQLGRFGRIIGEPTECQLTVRVYDPALDVDTPYPTTSGHVPGALAGTMPGRSLLVALNDAEQPIWAGLVLRRTSGADEWVQVSASTLEHYLSRRFVGDLSFTGADQAAIVAGIIDGVAVDGIGFIVDAPDTGITRDRDYFDDEDKTALSVLQDLMGVEDGPELTVDLVWANASRTRLAYVVRVRQQLGASPAVPVEFTLPGSVTSFEFIEDYTEGNGANDVLATSSGEGDIRPTSEHHIAADYIAGGWAKFEERFEPSTSITRTSVLDAHAAEELTLMKDGLNELSLVANLDAAPRLDSDWRLGDVISASLTCPRFPAYTGPDGGLVPGFTSRVRVVGWEADYDERTITPRVRPV